MDLSVTLKGQSHDLKLKNPVLTASGTFGYGVEFASYGDLAALGGIVVKGLSLQPREGNPCPRIVETTAGMLNAVGLQNDGVEAFCRDKLPRLPWRETPVIVNMYATSPAEFGELAARLDGEEGVAALEVNVSCPNVREGGVLFGQDPRLAAAVTAAVRERAPHKHVMVKLSPNVTDIALMARSVEDAGADSISCINTLLGMSVDLRTRRPSLANVVGGLSGPAIRPIARLDELHHRDGALLHPVLAQVDAGAVVHMSASHAEVKETFLAPVRFFRENPPQVYHYPLRAEVGEDFPYHLIGFDRGYRWRAGGMEVPIWSYRGHAVWGLTARIIKHLMEQLAEGEESNTPPVAAP